jgi:hypothetical protein
MPKLVRRPDVGSNLELFDRRPIQLEGFTHRTRAVVVGRPKFDQWLAACSSRMRRRSPRRTVCRARRTMLSPSMSRTFGMKVARGRTVADRAVPSVPSNVDNLGISEVASIARLQRRMCHF